MAEYALIEIPGNTIREYREFAAPPPDVSRKGVKWLPVIVTDPACDPAIQMKEGPAVTVLPDKVLRIWSVRPLSAAELDSGKEDHLNALDKLGFAIDFDHENRIRVLEGKPPVTAAQFRAALKARI